MVKERQAENNHKEFVMPPMPDGLFSELSERASRKDNKLSKSVRTHIRRLKQEGRFAQALAVRKSVVSSRESRLGRQYLSQAKARGMLNGTLRELLATDDEEREAELELRAIWLLEITGEIDSEERVRELEESLDSKADQLRAYLESKLPEIRDEMVRLKT